MAESSANVEHSPLRGRAEEPRGALGPAERRATPVYDRLTEGFETADLIAAKALLASVR